jgi:hypothetical protein
LNICGKELADCLQKATADGMLPPRCSIKYKINVMLKIQTLHVFQGYKIHPKYQKFSLLSYCINRKFTMLYL